MEKNELIFKLHDLHNQATNEKSHHYTAKLIREAIRHLSSQNEPKTKYGNKMIKVPTEVSFRRKDGSMVTFKAKRISPSEPDTNNTQQGERVRLRKHDNTSDEVTVHASQSTSNKRDMGNPVETFQPCGKTFEVEFTFKNGNKDLLVCRCGDDDGLCKECTANHDKAKEGDDE